MATPVSIDDARVAKLLNNPAMRRKFPFLASAFIRINKPPPASGCGGCRGKKKGNTAEYANIRKSIGQMPIDKKAELKQALGGGQVIVKYSVNRAKRVTLKF